MKKSSAFTISFLALTFLGFNALAEHISWDELPLIDNIDRALSVFQHTESNQKKAEEPLRIVGPRCLNHWDKYEKQINAIDAELIAETKAAHQSLKHISSNLLITSDSKLELSEVCGAKGADLELKIVKTIDALEKGHAELEKHGDAIEGIRKKVGKTLYADALADYSRGWSCMFESYYTDVVKAAYFSIDYPGNGGKVFNPLDQSDEKLYRVKSKMKMEQEGLVNLLSQFDSLKKRCHLLTGSKHTEDLSSQEKVFADLGSAN